MTEIVGCRASQISQTGIAMIEIGDLDDPILIAKKELMMRKCPLALRREVGIVYDKKSDKYIKYIEIWDPNQMQFATTYKV